MDECDHDEMCAVKVIMLFVGGHTFIARFRMCQMDRIPCALYGWAEKKDIPFTWHDACVMLANILYFVHGRAEGDNIFLSEEVLKVDRPRD